MTRLSNLIYHTKYKFNVAGKHFLFRHPFLGYLACFIGVPALILIAVTVTTTIFSLPFALILELFPS